MTATHVDLPKTMRSVICYGPEDYRLEEIAVPTVSTGEEACAFGLTTLVKQFSGA